jgi:hypothetical protein
VGLWSLTAHIRKDINLLPLPGIQPRFVEYPVTIPTELFRLAATIKKVLSCNNVTWIEVVTVVAVGFAGTRDEIEGS